MKDSKKLKMQLRTYFNYRKHGPLRIYIICNYIISDLSGVNKFLKTAALSVVPAVMN